MGGFLSLSVVVLFLCGHCLFVFLPLFALANHQEQIFIYNDSLASAGCLVPLCSCFLSLCSCLVFVVVLCVFVVVLLDWNQNSCTFELILKAMLGFIVQMEYEH